MKNICMITAHDFQGYFAPDKYPILGTVTDQPLAGTLTVGIEML